MFRYEWFRAQDIERPAASNRTPALQALLSGALNQSRNWRSNDLIVLVAFDGEQPAGHVKFTYGHASRLGERIRFAAAQDLFTDSKYRGQGIGSTLISKCVEIGMPCQHSGISGQAMPLFKKLGLSFIDCAPIYQLPMSFPALIREWRSSLYRVEASPAAHSGSGVLEALRLTLRSRQSVKNRGTTTWIPLDAHDSCNEIERLAKVHSRMFQIPRSSTLLSSALMGHSQTLHAVILEASSPRGRVRHLVTIYRRDASVRIPLTSRRVELADGLINEIYPPVADHDDAVGILRATARYARGLGFDNLSICAMTDALQSACKYLGLNSSASKSVAIQPAGVSEALAAEMVRPENWWCRAINENQLEEAA